MKALNTLIRLSKKTLDELRRNMADLENQKSALEQTILSLKKDLDTEVDLAKKQVEMSTFFGEFAKRIKNRQDAIRVEIKNIDAQIVKLNNEIFIAFTELKKYEIARDNVKKKAAFEASRKETIMLDEIASQQHHRKTKA